MNDFTHDLKYSLESFDSESFDNFYRYFFRYVSEIKIVTDRAMQAHGVDKIVVLDSGKEIFIEEKKRTENYGDMLFEEYSSFDSKTKGWLEKYTYTDYLAYAIMPVRKLYFFPFWILRVTFRNNYELWLSKYDRKIAKNNGYRTSNIPVPFNVLMDAMTVTMIDNIIHPIKEDKNEQTQIAFK